MVGRVGGGRELGIGEVGLTGSSGDRLGGAAPAGGNYPAHYGDPLGLIAIQFPNFQIAPFYPLPYCEK